jgi:hypothetical protein
MSTRRSSVEYGAFRYSSETTQSTWSAATRRCCIQAQHRPGANGREHQTRARHLHQLHQQRPWALWIPRSWKRSATRRISTNGRSKAPTTSTQFIAKMPTHRFGSPCLEHIYSITDAAKARRDASGHQPGQRFPVLALKSGPFLLRCMGPVLVRLRRSHQRFECRLIGAKPA